MEIREITEEERMQALDLAGKVFLEFEGPDYTQDGIDEFNRSIHDPEYIGMLRIYGAFEAGEMMGMLATRSEGTHMALFFVDGKYHRKGIGRKLFERACADNPSDKMTVNAAPYAYEIYHKLGFVDTDAEEIVQGIRSTPMVYILK